MDDFIKDTLSTLGRYNCRLFFSLELRVFSFLTKERRPVLLRVDLESCDFPFPFPSAIVEAHSFFPPLFQRCVD